MIAPCHTTRYFLYRKPTDMRFGIDSLAGLVRNELGFDTTSGDVFLLQRPSGKRNLKNGLKEQAVWCFLRTEITISQKPSVYATKWGMVMAVLGLMMVAWPLAARISQREFQIGLALIFYSGAGFFIYMVYRSCKKKASE